jgi:hypothetical protein
VKLHDAWDETTSNAIVNWLYTLIAADAIVDTVYVCAGT